MPYSNYHYNLANVFLSRKDESRLLKRKEQNRAAQRAFRERKEKHVKDVGVVWIGVFPSWLIDDKS
jgi:hypothetical protein